MISDTDTRISYVLKKIIDDFGIDVFADKEKAIAVIDYYFLKNNISDEKMLIDHAIKSGVIEIITNAEKSNYADCRKKALQILTEEQFIARKWADKLLSWFDTALDYNDIQQNPEISEDYKEEQNEDSHNEYSSPVDAILDDNNTDNIFLYDDTGEKVEFEQIAVVPLREKIYVILRPVIKLPGMKDGEALVFVIDEIDDEEILYVTDDIEAIDEVFDQYYKMLRDAGVDVS